MGRYLVALAPHPWTTHIYHEKIERMPGTWGGVDNPDDLPLAIQEFQPDKIFFLHWHWKVPPAIVRDYECIAFHMTALPYGRGGSPLQHLILRGHTTTTLTAFRMTDELDAGPIYLQAPLPLEGSAEEIYSAAAFKAAQMIRALLRRPRVPVPQHGEPVTWRRRAPEESAIGDLPDLPHLYDHVRMLDATDYPRAFLRHGRFRYEFSEARLTDGGLEACVRITEALCDVS